MTQCKGIIAAGGSGTRRCPVTKVVASVQQRRGKLMRVVQGAVFHVNVSIRRIAPNDPIIGICCSIFQGEPALSTKDQQGKPLTAAKHFA